MQSVALCVPAAFPFSAQVVSWETFDVFALGRAAPGCCLQLVTMTLLEQLGVVGRLGLCPAHLRAFLALVEAGYSHDNPYHNNLHATDVVQSLGVLLLSDSWAEELEDVELLAMVLAAACHDLGHPGECRGRGWGG